MFSSVFKFDLVVCVVWMYYVVGNIQNEIVEWFGILCQMVQCMVVYVVDVNLVKVQIMYLVLFCLELVQGLQECYGLEVCCVVLGVGGVENFNELQEVQQMLVVVGVEVMEQYFSLEVLLVVNVGLGCMFKVVIEWLLELECLQYQIVLMIGVFVFDGLVNCYDVVL